MELLSTRVQDPDNGVAQLALQALSAQLQGATTTMTSVPLPLKFLRPYFNDLEAHYVEIEEGNPNKLVLADVLSILATVVANTSRKALHYRLVGTKDALTSWGHEYLRNICGELTAEFEARHTLFLEAVAASTQPTPKLELNDLLELVALIVPFYIRHHNEIEAVDLLNEVQQIETILQHVDATNFQRITNYLLALSDFAASEDDRENMLNVAFRVFITQKEPCQAIRVALKLNNACLVDEAIASCECPMVKRQMGYLLSSMQWKLTEAQQEEEGLAVASNEWLSETYKLLGKELDVMEPKLPEDIYKTNLDDKRGNNGFFLDSAKMNLASTFVNAFVNVGFGTDKLMTPEDTTWVFKNRSHGVTSAAASLGAIMLWDVDEGLSVIDKFRWSNEPAVKAGALMAFGLVCCSIKNPCDPAYGLLADQLEGASGVERDGAILGLGVAHAGWQREDLLHALVPLIIDTSLPVDTSAFAALSLGLTFIGSGNGSAAEALVQTLIERQFMPANLHEPAAFLFAVALGLLFLGKKDQSEATCEALQAVGEHPIGAYAIATLSGCAYAGSGDVTKVQQFLKSCSEVTPSEEPAVEDDSTEKPADKASDTSTTDPSGFIGSGQAASVLAMALVALGEPCGCDMQLRMIDHLLQYGSPKIRKAIPLVLALLSTSNPRPAVVESLSKLSHDSDVDVALNAVLGLGLVGAGTNNAKIAELLRTLASSYYSRNLNGLFCVRLSQGLLFMGKGLVSLSSVISDGFLVSPVPLGCLLVVLHSCLFLKTTLLGRFHFLLYLLIPAIRPRMLTTVDEDLKPLQVTVRVGQAVDVAGQAGKPRTITGFQTHTTPVLLGAGERAELGTDEYVPVCITPLEGVVILKKVVSAKSADVA